MGCCLNMKVCIPEGLLQEAEGKGKSLPRSCLILEAAIRADWHGVESGSTDRLSLLPLLLLSFALPQGILGVLQHGLKSLHLATN